MLEEIAPVRINNPDMDRLMECILLCRHRWSRDNCRLSDAPGEKTAKDPQSLFFVSGPTLFRTRCRRGWKFFLVMIETSWIRSDKDGKDEVMNRIFPERKEASVRIFVSSLRFSRRIGKKRIPMRFISLISFLKMLSPPIARSYDSSPEKTMVGSGR